MNKVQPLEEEKVLQHVKKNPEKRCRRIAYELEKEETVFIGKSKVAQIMKANNLNHPFVRGYPKKEYKEPEDLLLHEPWKKNLLWGTDWSWVNVEDRFMYLVILLDWYSRLIVSWGLFPQVTSQIVTSVITDAIAKQGIDFLPEGAMKPRIVADHGSANTSQHTKYAIEVQGMELWLSGIGRPTGNARTERVIGTLKHEEINLQECYTSEKEAQTRIGKAIVDYNMNRPNQGNGGFAPASVHAYGRKLLWERRRKARQTSQDERRQFWKNIES
jgi:putative transposase